MGTNKHRNVEIRAKSLSQAGRLLGYCARHNGEKGVALLDGNDVCLGFISLQDIQEQLNAGPYIEV